MTEPLCQSLSKIRHDLNLIPKQFETNPEPILVEQHGKPVFAIVPIDGYLVMEAALDYIRENDLADEFEDWMEEEGLISDADERSDSEEEDQPDDGDITTKTMDLLKSKGFIDDPAIRQSMKEHCLKTITEIEEYEKSLA